MDPARSGGSLVALDMVKCFASGGNRFRSITELTDFKSNMSFAHISTVSLYLGAGIYLPWIQCEVFVVWSWIQWVLGHAYREKYIYKYHGALCAALCAALSFALPSALPFAV